MASRPLSENRGWTQFRRGLATQMQVIGALLMRELHTRYGRDNIGYLWVIGEPLTLATAIGAIHAFGGGSHSPGEIGAVPFSVLGYTVFIMFRGIFGRAEGAVESNMPLLYHKMVTVFDIMLSRALLETAGTFLSLVILLALLTSIGWAEPPARPLYMLLGLIFMFWFSFAMGLICVAITHDNRLLGRMVHPVAYIMMPLSGAFFQVRWIPEPYRTWFLWYPMPHIFEMTRYGFFTTAADSYFSIPYTAGCCLVLTYIGLVSIKLLRGRVHLH